MYTIVVAKKKTKMEGHDYTFKDFSSFYELADVITFPLIGRYSVGIQSDVAKDIQDFIKVQSKYAALIITIYAQESIVDYLSLYDTSLPIKGIVSPYDTFKELVSNKSILFGRGVMQLMYSSIEHSFSEMDEALNKVLIEYGAQVLITEEMLSSLFILNETVYPRSVLISFINMAGNRHVKLNKCLEDVGNDVALGAIIKNLKAFVKDKTEYFKTGKGTPLIKSLNTNNLNQLYRILILERNGLNDVCLLLSLYERGLSSNDIVQRQKH